jgi:hypothetical protein
VNPALLASLLDESSSAESSMASDPSSPGTEAVRSVARRNLNALVPEAIRTLETGLNTGLPADRRLAAQAILDRAPATAPSSTSSPPAPALAPEVASLLVTALSRMFSPLAPPPAERKLNEEGSSVAEGNAQATFTIIEEADTSVPALGEQRALVPAPRRAAASRKGPVHGSRVPAKVSKGKRK